MKEGCSDRMECLGEIKLVDSPTKRGSGGALPLEADLAASVTPPNEITAGKRRQMKDSAG